MNQEDVLVLLVVFVLGFVVSQMMSGRLVEGINIGGMDIGWGNLLPRGFERSFDDFTDDVEGGWHKIVN